MTFDQLLKKIVAYNVAAYGHMLKINILGPRGKEIQELAKHGYQNNLFLAKQLEDITLLAGDEESASMEQSMVQGAFQALGPVNPAPQSEATKRELSPDELREARDIAYLDRLYALEYDEKEKSAVAEQEKQKSGTETNGGTAANDWYANIFGGAGGNQAELPKESGTPSPDSTEGESPQGQ